MGWYVEAGLHLIRATQVASIAHSQRSKASQAGAVNLGPYG